MLYLGTDQEGNMSPSENAPHVCADHGNAGARGECPRLPVSL